jgi:hypothetical protein
MTGGADPLDALRGVHLPAGLPRSALADLAWAGAGGFLAAVALALLAAVLLARRRPVRRAARAALARSRSLPPPERLIAQAALLRRLAGAVGTEPPIERGGAWLARLDRVFGTAFFTGGPGAAFGDALYAPASRPDPDALDRELERLISGLRR